MKKIITLLLFISTIAFGESKAVLDAKITDALHAFDKEINGGMRFLNQSPGYLVFPEVVKAGFVVGGEYGEGALIENKPAATKEYYSMTSASIGLQAGAQKTTYIIIFTTEKILHNFKVSNGIEGSIELAKWGDGKDISSLSFEKPIIVFALNQKGLMYNLNIKGTKFQRIVK